MNPFPPSNPLAPHLLVARARENMAAEWAADNRLSSEWYFERDPALAADPDSALDLIFQEFVLRDEAGEAPSADQFAARFPALEQPLRRLIALDDALSRSGSDETTSLSGEGSLTHTKPSKAYTAVAAGTESPPSTFGRYPVLEALGSGGQADVFLGIHPKLGREVVIKRLRGSAETAGQLVAEGRILAALDHPNLARVHDLDVADGRPFLVMELIRGRNLAEVRKHAPVSTADTVRWVAAIARATEHAHARGVLHLDIKPRNVMLDETGRVVLIDFGLARVQRGLEPLDVDNNVSGTLAYMPPEQARGENDLLGPPTDVFGLGGVLYYLLVGSDPIRGAGASELFAKARVGEWDRDRLKQSGAPLKLIAVCERALDPDRLKRFHSAAAFADAVEAAVARPRWPRIVGPVALALLLVTGLVAWMASRPGSAPTEITPGKPAPIIVQPDLRFTLGVYRAKKFFTDFPTPFAIGEEARISATIPAGYQSTLILATESGTVSTLLSEPRHVAEHSLAYPTSPDSKQANLFRFKEPAGTHVFLLIAVPSDSVSREQLKFRPNERWPRLPYDTVIRVRDGKATVEAKGRDIEPGGAVEDPEGEVVARLTNLLRNTPPGSVVEGVAFSVKPRP